MPHGLIRFTTLLAGWRLAIEFEPGIWSVIDCRHRKIFLNRDARMILIRSEVEDYDAMLALVPPDQRVLIEDARSRCLKLGAGQVVSATIPPDKSFKTYYERAGSIQAGGFLIISHAILVPAPQPYPQRDPSTSAQS